MGKRITDDEDMILEIGKTGREDNAMYNSQCIIYDARPKLSAAGNKFKGGGYEDLRNYCNSELIFCDIDNIHEVRKVYQKMSDIKQSADNFNSSQTYQQLIEASGY